MLVSLQLSGTPVLGHQMPSSGLPRHPHTCNTHLNTHTHIHTKEKKDRLPHVPCASKGSTELQMDKTNMAQCTAPKVSQVPAAIPQSSSARTLNNMPSNCSKYSPCLNGSQWDGDHASPLSTLQSISRCGVLLGMVMPGVVPRLSDMAKAPYTGTVTTLEIFTA